MIISNSNATLEVPSLRPWSKFVSRNLKHKENLTNA